MRRLRRYRCCCCRAVADAASSAIAAASVAVDRNTHAAILDGAAYAATVAADAGYTWSAAAAAGRCQCTVVGGERAPPGDAAISVGRLWAGRTWTMFAAADGAAAAGVPPR